MPTRAERSRELHNMLATIGGVRQIVHLHQRIVERSGMKMADGIPIADMIPVILDVEFPTDHQPPAAGVGSPERP
jgi:hypothetical protein